MKSVTVLAAVLVAIMMLTSIAFAIVAVMMAKHLETPNFAVRGVIGGILGIVSAGILWKTLRWTQARIRANSSSRRQGE